MYYMKISCVTFSSTFYFLEMPITYVTVKLRQTQRHNNTLKQSKKVKVIIIPKDEDGW